LRRSSLSPQQRIILILISGVFIALFYRACTLPSLAHWQSSTSLYSASRLLHGEVIYKDFWYDRAPGTVLCNTLALATSGEIHSILILLIIFTFIAAVFFFKSLRNSGIEKDSALAGTLLLVFWAMSLPAIGWRNSASEWVLPFLGCYMIFTLRTIRTGGGGSAAVAGAAAGVATLFLPHEALLLVLFVAAAPKRIVHFIAGFVTVISLALLSLDMTDNIEPIKFCVWDYHLAVIKAGGWRRFFEEGWTKLFILLFALSPMATLFYRSPGPAIEVPWKLRLTTSARKMIIVWLCMEMLVLLVSGNLEPAALIPAMLPATFIWTFKLESFKNRGAPPARGRYQFATGVTLAGFIAMALLASGFLPQKTTEKPLELDHGHIRLMRQVVRQNLSQEQDILVWSPSAATYFVLDRPSPSFYPTIMPLLTKDYSSRSITKFIREIEKTRPEMLVLETSALPAGISEDLSGRPAITAGTEQETLFDYMQKLIREDFQILSAQERTVFCIRKKAGTPP